MALGNPGAPAALGLFGGVHGLERIGSDVVITWLHSLAMRLPWDVSLHALLERVRLVFMPIVNPGGMLRGTRANPQGVDLMRNAPVDAQEPVPFLVGGQRISAGLPWYRGAHGGAMQSESTALCELVERELLGRPFSLAMDCHSGFGLRDRIWFPFAQSAIWPSWTRCMKYFSRATATILMCSSRRAASTWRMATCGTTCTCGPANGRTLSSCH